MLVMYYDNRVHEFLNICNKRQFTLDIYYIAVGDNTIFSQRYSSEMWLMFMGNRLHTIS
jgi:hypothetical protein